MNSPQDTSHAQFHQLLVALDQINELLVTSSSQLTAIASQALQIRQHLLQLKSVAPTPNTDTTLAAPWYDKPREESDD